MDKSGGGDPQEGGSSTPPTSSSSSTSSPALGCGSNSSGNSPGTNSLTLNVTTTTGGSFSVIVDSENSVENLKKIISKKLKVSKDRICLLHRERELNDGTLHENGLLDGSKLILTPNVETGLLAQRAENTVMQALESLNDSQVNDFLSGKSPLNLSVRLGDHMMLIQLQLSTLNSSSQSGNRSKAHKSRTVTASSTNVTHTSNTNLIQASSSRSHGRTALPISFRRIMASDNTIPAAQPIVDHVREAQSLTKQEIENIHSIVKNLTENDNSTIASIAPAGESILEHNSIPKVTISESPIKSLSNLVSSSVNTSNIPPSCNNNASPESPPLVCADPISANLTSCLCRRLDNNDNNSCESNCQTRIPEQHQPSTSITTLHRTAHNPIARHKAKIQTLRKHTSFDGSALQKSDQEMCTQSGSLSAPNSPQRISHTQLQQSRSHHYQHHNLLQQSQLHLNQQAGTSSSQSRVPTGDPNNVENPALAEASRNLTQTLRKLSKRVFTNKSNDQSQDAAGKISNSGAVIESMKHHGKGIYSGTFSGTLNPALQDKFGRPKRDISTIIHILNDLLSAAPQCARTGTKIYFEPTQPTPTTIAPANGVNSGVNTTNPTSTTSTRSSNNLQTTVAMAPSTLTNNDSSSNRNSFTNPAAIQSPRLVTRCVPTPIQTKKFPSSVTTVTIAGPSASDCILCKSQNTSLPSTSSAVYARCNHHQKMIPKVLCKCGHPLTATTTASSNSSSNNSYQCQRCAAISAAELENSKTKSKLDNLRLIMQQKKERREARKQKCAPYSMTTSLAISPSALVLAGGSGSTLEPVRTVHRQLAAPTNTTANDIEMMNTAAVVESVAPAPSATTTAADITASSQESTNSTHTSIGSTSSNNSAATATATATTTTSATAAAAATGTTATSSEATQNAHQLVEEVDTVA
ncbi:midnolin homolog [Malaya genurostris]|uniref:midnolin homolog n=1 Tax=Malaya genurostris TaxID=325434 RepID=UPI0026F40636|nr:midnolin homolog [Malaya genurostris]XP_058443108.1 midnolin homolog [Malaya genurostris]XP_058443109.1 midnolin homolog [Malaya genurostris]XP_058443110.1 midnolin homolog [Malaya genurostris]